MEDLRGKKILERQWQVANMRLAQLAMSENTSVDKRRQAIDEREKKVANTLLAERVDQDLVAAPQIEPQKPNLISFEESGVLQRSLETIIPHGPPTAKAGTSGAISRSAGRPTTSKGLPPLYECAERLKEKIRLFHDSDNLYGFNGKCYDLLLPDDIVQLYMEKVDDQLGGERNLNSINHLHKFLRMDKKIAVNEIKGNQKIAVLANGVFDVRTGELRKHSYKDMTFSYINANYLERGKCKTFRELLRCITRGDEVLQERFWQFLGYLLMQTNEAKVFFVMGFAPDSGKSLVGNFIESLFDERYVSNIALNDFNRSFALAPIVGRAVNISLDLPATKLKASAVSLLKMLTGGDAFNVNQKYVPEFRYRNRAKFLFASNFPIELYENDDAFWRRLVYLPFDYGVSKEDQNPDLPEMLQAERDAIVSEALRHAKTLVDNNFVFPTTPLIERRMQEWQGHTNSSIENFLHDCCILDVSYKGELMDHLFSAYERYCESLGVVPKNRQFFKQFLETETGLKHGKIRDGRPNPQSAFRGIKLMEGFDA